jgi:hypothetical protein
MTTSATLYRDGMLVVNVFTDCANPFYGLRGRVVVVVRDGHGHAIGMTAEIRCATRGGLLDPFMYSSGRETFLQKLPPDVGERAVDLDIWQSDEGHYELLRFGQVAVAVGQ